MEKEKKKNEGTNGRGKEEGIEIMLSDKYRKMWIVKSECAWSDVHCKNVWSSPFVSK